MIWFTGKNIQKNTHPFAEGLEAYKQGKQVEDNPYTFKSDIDAATWHRGWSMSVPTSSMNINLHWKQEVQDTFDTIVTNLSDMKPYNKEASCASCGHASVNTTYMTRSNIAVHTVSVKCNLTWISRLCTNCGYTWGEKPLNYQTPELFFS